MVGIDTDDIVQKNDIDLRIFDHGGKCAFIGGEGAFQRKGGKHVHGIGGGKPVGKYGSQFFFCGRGKFRNPQSLLFNEITGQNARAAAERQDSRPAAGGGLFDGGQRAGNFHHLLKIVGYGYTRHRQKRVLQTGVAGQTGGVGKRRFGP